MKSSKLIPFQSVNRALLVCLCAVAIQGCSGSSDSAPEQIETGSETTANTTNAESGASNDASNVSGMDELAEQPVAEQLDNPAESVESPVAEAEPSPIPSPTEMEPASPATTRVDFNITVPAYMSDELQIRLVWGDITTSAAWVRDETWAISETFPVNTENPLLVTFSDRNGAITLGTFESQFLTETDASETFQITADQFDTASWDSDNDGTSNLDELIIGTDPREVNSAAPSTQLPTAVQIELELVQDKTFRINWQLAEGAEFYRVLENADGLSGFIQVSNDLNGSVQSFNHRVALFKKFNASYIVQSCNTSGCMDSEAIAVSGTLDQAIGYFKADNIVFEQYFGDKVSLSMDGNTLAVGASGRPRSSIGTVSDQGESDAVYVFQRNDGRWLFQAQLNSNTNDGFAAGFGSDISLSADGSTLAIGAVNENSFATASNSNQVESSGAVYIFALADDEWQQQAYLTASNAGTNDGFGTSVSLSQDGNSLAIGATFEGSASTGVNGDQTDNTLRDSGAAYVFQHSDGEWQQQAYIKATNPDEADWFGYTVSLSADGNTLVVGAPFESSAATGINGGQSDNSLSSAGAAYVFNHHNGIWQQQAYIKASNTGLGDLFGRAVSLSTDGSTLAVGAPSERSSSRGVNGNQNDDDQVAGAVYVFELSDGAWQQLAYLKASNTFNNFVAGPRGANFGGTVSLAGDGKTLAVGARGETSFATGINGDQSPNPAFVPGAAYVFEASGSDWRQIAYVKASNTDSGDRFGTAVSLSLDGNSLAVGATDEESHATGVNGDQTDNSGRFEGTGKKGAAYLY